MDQKHKISDLKKKIEEHGINDFKKIKGLFSQVIKDVLGVDNSLSKKAEGIVSGWEVEGAWLHINGLISDEEFRKNEYNAYLDLLFEIETYLDVFSSKQENEGKSITHKEISEHSRPTVFISYCWDDSHIADEIEQSNLKEYVDFSRDTKNIGSWDSISEFMKSINNHDYAVLVISDKYLKSQNCMYEVLELIKLEDYSKKIFPVIIESKIYEPEGRITYLDYWKEKYDEIDKLVRDRDLLSVKDAIKDLEIRLLISQRVYNFLSVISDMNNPKIVNVCDAIENVLRNKKIIQISK